jgi:hypothetical protein
MSFEKSPIAVTPFLFWVALARYGFNRRSRARFRAGCGAADFFSGFVVKPTYVNSKKLKEIPGSLARGEAGLDGEPGGTRQSARE